MLTIRSSSSDRQLLIQNAGGGAFEVELTGHPVQASICAWVEMDLDTFVAFFDELGQMDHPWKGERKWWSMEGELALSATCTSLGVVVFRVALCGMQGAPEAWRLELENFHIGL